MVEVNRKAYARIAEGLIRSLFWGASHPIAAERIARPLWVGATGMIWQLASEISAYA